MLVRETRMATDKPPNPAAAGGRPLLTMDSGSLLVRTRYRSRLIGSLPSALPAVFTDADVPLERAGFYLKRQKASHGATLRSGGEVGGGNPDASDLRGLRGVARGWAPLRDPPGRALGDPCPGHPASSGQR